VHVGFHVHGFWTAVFGSIVVSVVSWLVGLVLPDPE
jgi:putative membrane protein